MVAGAAGAAASSSSRSLLRPSLGVLRGAQTSAAGCIQAAGSGSDRRCGAGIITDSEARRTFCSSPSTSRDSVPVTAAATAAIRGLSLRRQQANTLSSSRRAFPGPPAHRALHSLPELPIALRNAAGCEPLFSETTVKLLWDDWQSGLLSKLNDEIRGTQWENASIAETVIGTARDPHSIQAFNYASIALNNSFFLSGLKPKDLPAGVSSWEDVTPPKPPPKLLDRIERDFDSLPAFKLAFSSAAYGMASSGYVWLVQDRHGVLGIVPTYGAGTVLIQNRIQRDGAREEWTEASVVERSTPTPPSPPPQQQQQGGAGGRGVRAFSTSPASSYRRGTDLDNLNDERAIEHRGEELFPLLCVSVHERDWLPDYGMWGKEEYLMRFWECVDWQRVHRLHEAYSI